MDAEQWSDRELLAAIREGDREALARLYRKNCGWLVARLSRRCADGGTVEEVVQDTFVAVWRGAHRYRGQGEVAAWIYRIAICRLVDRWRGRAPTSALLDEVTSSEPSAEDEVLARIQYGPLGQALERLSPELLSVVQAVVFDGLTIREAGRLLGIPTGTVKTRM